MCATLSPLSMLVVVVFAAAVVSVRRRRAAVEVVRVVARWCGDGSWRRYCSRWWWWSTRGPSTTLVVVVVVVVALVTVVAVVALVVVVGVVGGWRHRWGEVEAVRMLADGATAVRGGGQGDRRHHRYCWWSLLVRVVVFGTHALIAEYLDVSSTLANTETPTNIEPTGWNRDATMNMSMLETKEGERMSQTAPETAYTSGVNAQMCQAC